MSYIGVICDGDGECGSNIVYSMFVDVLIYIVDAKPMMSLVARNMSDGCVMYCKEKDSAAIITFGSSLLWGSVIGGDILVIYRLMPVLVTRLEYDKFQPWGVRNSYVLREWLACTGDAGGGVGGSYIQLNGGYFFLM